MHTQTAVKRSLAVRNAESRLSSEDPRRELLESPNRRKICSEIRCHEGIHFRELVRRLGVAPANLWFHLRRLERAGLLVSRWSRGRRRLFTKSGGLSSARSLVGQRQHQILDLLRIAPGSTQTHIARVFDIGMATVNYHIRVLCLLGLVETRRDKHWKRCYLRQP